MELSGKIILDLPLESGVSRAGNQWRKKSWVLETFDQFPRKVKFDTFGDRVDSLQFVVGQDYTVSVDAESREFNGRWYTDLRAYASRAYEGAPQGGGYHPQPAYAPQSAAPAGGYGQPAFAPASGAQGPVPPMPQMPDLPQADSSEDLPF